MHAGGLHTHAARTYAESEYATSTKECKAACMETPETCADIDTINGKCFVHYKGVYKRDSVVTQRHAPNSAKRSRFYMTACVDTYCLSYVIVYLCTLVCHCLEYTHCVMQYISMMLYSSGTRYAPDRICIVK